MPGPTNISVNAPSRLDGPEGMDIPGFYRYGNEWHSRKTRKTYHYVSKNRWVEVSDSRDFWDFCETHQRREPLPPSGNLPAFKSCTACFHVWLTKDEFEWDIEYRNGTLRIPDSDDELICPLCSNFF